MHEYAAQMQRVEIAGLNGKNLPIERLGLGQLSALVVINGSPKDVGNARFCGLRVDLWFGHGLEGVANATRNATLRSRRLRQRITREIIRL
jgi:hypothetical protein